MLPKRLLTSKLAPPPTRPTLVGRPRLLKRLDEALSTGCRLVLVSAPAGYGKTTLVSAWNAGRMKEDLNASSFIPPPSSLCWLTLDPEDNDPARFFAYLAAALQRVDEGLGSSLESLVEQPQFPPVHALMEELIHEISQLDRSVLLVLDDYHAIHNPTIHEALETLLEHQPENLVLIVTTREDPPFPLGRLRARGQLLEIRTRDLRFMTEEADEFLNQGMRLGVPEPAVRRLEEMTEGWIAGLQLAGLAVQGQEDPAGLIENFRGSHRYIIEYLLEEVLKRQTEEVRGFLVRTSILDRLCAELCDEITKGDPGESSQGLRGGRTYGDEKDSFIPGNPSTLDSSFSPVGPSSFILSLLERSNLFLVPLDETGTWFRYHRLFADVLRAGLDAETEMEMHRRAAGWFEREGFPNEAIRHSLAGGQTREAARLIRREANRLLKQGEMYTLLGWIDALPSGEVLGQPDLAMIKVMALLLTGDVGKAAVFARQVEEQPQTGTQPAAPGRLLAIKAWLMFTSGGSLGLSGLAQQALDALEPEDTFFRIMALLALGTGELWVGDIDASCRAYQQAANLGEEIGHAFGAIAALSTLALNLYAMGELRKAEAVCRDALARYVDRRGRPLPVLGMVYISLGTICYHQNRLRDAEEAARLGLELCRKQLSSGVVGGEAELILAELAFARGEIDLAMDWVQKTRRFAQEHKINFLDYKMDILETNFRLWLGDTVSARLVLDRLEKRLQDSLPLATRSIQLLRGNLLLQEGKPAEALAILDELEIATRKEKCFGRLIPIRVLQAAACADLGKEVEALAALKEAVRLAAPEGYRRYFLGHRSKIAPLLAKARAEAPLFVDELLGLTGPREEPGKMASPAQIPSGNSGLIEPLSEQELNVLRMLVAGCSNQEIAQQLVITPGTAKWHVHNILGKLGARNRAQAILRARQLGLG